MVKATGKNMWVDIPTCCESKRRPGQLKLLIQRVHDLRFAVLIIDWQQGNIFRIIDDERDLLAPSIQPRAFGGNLDNKELGAGSTLFLPVFVPGALFSAGDGHAVQGDGEVCVTAIECCLSGVFEFHLHKATGQSWPRGETPAEYITMGIDEDLDDAAKQALREMIALIVERTNLSREDAYTLCSLAADMRITQLVNGNKGVHCVLKKDYVHG